VALEETPDGVLITHVGLLTMLAGGVLNFFYGVDGTMQLLDNKEIAEQNSLENRSRQVYLTQNNVVQVTRSVTDKDGLKRKETKEFPINTGAIPWGSPLGEGIPIPPVIKSLSMLANPFPRSMDVKPYSDMRSGSARLPASCPHRESGSSQGEGVRVPRHQGGTQHQRNRAQSSHLAWPNQRS
jgi:hypothetical protein